VYAPPHAGPALRLLVEGWVVEPPRWPVHRLQLDVGLARSLSRYRYAAPLPRLVRLLGSSRRLRLPLSGIPGAGGALLRVRPPAHDHAPGRAGPPSGPKIGQWRSPLHSETNL